MFLVVEEQDFTSSRLNLSLLFTSKVHGESYKPDLVETLHG